VKKRPQTSDVVATHKLRRNQITINHSICLADNVNRFYIPAPQRRGTTKFALPYLPIVCRTQVYALNCILGERIIRMEFLGCIPKQCNVKVISVLHLNILHASCIYPTIEVRTVAFPAHEMLTNAASDTRSQNFINLKCGAFCDSNRC